MDQARKDNLSKKRREWLLKNPDSHPWRKKDKFISIPCEQLKFFLASKNIIFESEVLISKEVNYSVDILITSKNLILEINGNQHYNKDGTLKEYYKKRHDFINSLGWKIVEIHYTLAYNHELCLNIINDSNTITSILPFFKKEKRELKRIYGTRKDYSRKIKETNDKKNYLIAKKLKYNNNIEFSKFGWVNEASKIIGISPQKVSDWMKRYLFDFYEEKCFKRKK